jgi:hypothetical protein
MAKYNEKEIQDETVSSDDVLKEVEESMWDGYDDDDDDDNECEGHESLRGDMMGISVFCDGSCKTRKSAKSPKHR